MPFHRSQFGDAKPGDLLYEDRFKTVELGLAFRRLTCFRCEHTAIYKYRTQQIRRKEPLELAPDESGAEDALAVWNSIPRFAEVPEVIRCKKCGEVMGLSTECIY